VDIKRLLLFSLMNRDFDYENNNTVITSVLGECVKCKNFSLCGTVLPKSGVSMKGHYLCTSCDGMFGTRSVTENIGSCGKGILNLIENLDCIICLETKTNVSMPRCEHYMCVDCFKRCYYGDNSGEPLFPYPEIQDEFYKDTHYNAPNPKWVDYYPLIEEYEQEWELWNDRRLENCAKEVYLKQCPLCRK
jgi:hypothetical protein